MSKEGPGFTKVVTTGIDGRNDHKFLTEAHFLRQLLETEDIK